MFEDRYNHLIEYARKNTLPEDIKPGEKVKEWDEEILVIIDGVETHIDIFGKYLMAYMQAYRDSHENVTADWIPTAGQFKSYLIERSGILDQQGKKGRTGKPTGDFIQFTPGIIKEMIEEYVDDCLLLV